MATTGADLVDEKCGQGVVVILGIGVGGNDPKKLDVEELLCKLLQHVVHAHRHCQILRGTTCESRGREPSVNEKTGKGEYLLVEVDDHESA